MHKEYYKVHNNKIEILTWIICLYMHSINAVDAQQRSESDNGFLEADTWQILNIVES
jgi:hypothetical protein